MRRLMLLRHAKSAWSDGVADFDRPLAKRGREAAPRMGAYLSEEQLLPDLALVSPARRAQETWALVAPKLGDVATRAEPRLYEARAERLLGIARETGPEVRTLLMVGHNPGFEDLAKHLIGHGDRDALVRMMQKYPTAGLAVIDFAVDAWGEIGTGAGRLDRFISPKSLGQDEDD
jgi:phosphohistidine phosphatase